MTAIKSTQVEKALLKRDLKESQGIIDFIFYMMILESELQYELKLAIISKKSMII